MNLKYLCDEDLHGGAVRLASEERAMTQKLLWHLREIEARRLYLKYGAGSLHSYCTHVLKYSESSATRRVNASRLLSSLPELSDKILDGSLNLSNASVAQSFIQAEERRSRKKMSREEKETVASRVCEASQDEAKRGLLELLPHSTVGQCSSRPVSDGGTEFTFVMSAECLAKYERVRELNSHKPEFSTLSGVVEALLDEHLKRHGPSTRSHTAAVSPGVNGRRIYLSVALMAALHKRAGSCCEHVDENGQRCSRRYHLQVDHIVPLSAGGANCFSNFQLLCRPHNLKKGASLH